jgi:hypothetical protein
VPDTTVRKALDYLTALPVDRLETLLCAIAGEGGDASGPTWVPYVLTPDEALELDLFKRAQLASSSQEWSPPFRYASVPSLRAAAAQAKMDRYHGVDRGDISPEFEAYANSTKGARAPALRKAVKASLGAALTGLSAETWGGGEWRYAGQIDGRAILVEIDYGGRSAQLRYSMTIEGTPLKRVSYEGLLALGSGDWDVILEAAIDTSVELLVELVRKLAAAGAAFTANS